MLCLIWLERGSHLARRSRLGRGGSLQVTRAHTRVERDGGRNQQLSYQF